MCVRTAAKDVAAELNLNDEQVSVLAHVTSWFDDKEVQDPPPRGSPVVLIHGPFGTGKSTLLAAIIRLLTGQLQPNDVRSRPRSVTPSTGRILVASHTNVAVDRVLLALKDAGFDRFLRVGSISRVHKGLLAHSLHGADSRSSDAKSELSNMLKYCSDPCEEMAIREELARLTQGAERERKKMLHTVPVVGVTCCSSTLPLLDGLAFDIVILDEASQMIEPISLLPLVRMGCKYLICAGDPCQLPPVIASPSSLSGPFGTGVASLLRPLFVRLTHCGHQPHLLRKQYRCHPQISQVPNQHFYSGRLLDGCSVSDRPPLLPGLAPVTCVDVRGIEQQDNRRSTFNIEEARVTVHVLTFLKEQGIQMHRCGVICFFRAQVSQILQAATHAGLMSSQAAADQDGRGEQTGKGASSADRLGHQGLQVATVDAFQGAEKDVIILSTAITRAGGGSFASDAQRLNVSLTRSRHHLVVVGNTLVLSGIGNGALSDLLQVARATPGGFCPRGAFPPASVKAAMKAQEDATDFPVDFGGEAGGVEEEGWAAVGQAQDTEQGGMTRANADPMANIGMSPAPPKLDQQIAAGSVVKGHTTLKVQTCEGAPGDVGELELGDW